jgi:transposase-like protein
MNLLQVAKTFATEDMALAYWITTRWPSGVRCLACDNAKVYAITTKGKTGKVCRLFECSGCGLHFSATTGTLFHDSHLPLTKWFAAIALMVEAKKGMSANQVARHIGVSYKTAWHLCHRIRNAMSEAESPMLGGPGKIVEVDETFIGGKSRGKGCKAAKQAKIAVLGIAERGGRIHLKTIPNTTASAIHPILNERINSDTDKFSTDAAKVYGNAFPTGKHQKTKHKFEVRQKGFIESTRTIESAFSLFKRGIVGSYHKMSRDHMDSYLQEFCWRFNRRHMQPYLFDIALRNLGEHDPLPFKKLTHEVF